MLPDLLKMWFFVVFCFVGFQYILLRFGQNFPSSFKKQQPFIFQVAGKTTTKTHSFEPCYVNNSC